MASAIMYATRTVSGNQPAIRRLKEAATNTFKSGVPVMVNNAGFVIEWDGAMIARGIAGVTKEFGNNLAVAGTPQQITFGSVPNETSAVNIARPSFNDGLIGLELSNQDNIFFAEVGPAQTPVQADIGQQFGMTKDTDGHWYVDRTKTNIGVNTVCTVLKLDPNDTRGVQIMFTAGAAQIPA